MTTDDQSSRLDELLVSVGYRFFNGFDDEHPEFGINAHWFTRFTGGDNQVGPTVGSLLAARSSAMEHWFANATIETKPV